MQTLTEKLKSKGWIHLKDVNPHTMEDPANETMLDVEISRPDGWQPDSEILREYRIMYPGYNEFRIEDHFNEDGEKTSKRSVYAKK